MTIRKRLLGTGLLVLIALLGTLSIPATAHAAAASTWRQIVNSDDRCLSVLGGAPQHAAPVGMQPCTGASDQLWDFQDAGNGYYYLKVRHTGMCLNVANYGQADGAAIVQATCSNGTNERWLFWPSDNRFSWMVAQHSQKCLDRTGSNVVQWTCHKTWAYWQQWRVADTGIPVT